MGPEIENLKPKILSVMCCHLHAYNKYLMNEVKITRFIHDFGVCIFIYLWYFCGFFLKEYRIIH